MKIDKVHIGQTLNLIAVFFALFGGIAQTHAQSNPSNIQEMQHGFVLSADDTLGSHLVATGHHSRQAEIIGQLTIEDPLEQEIYEARKSQNAGRSYFLFQAQSLNLPALSAGQVLLGHIVESKIGGYEPKNVVVRFATFRVQKVLLNIPNPFFGSEVQH